MNAPTLAMSYSMADVLRRSSVRITSSQPMGPSGVALGVLMPDGRVGSIIVTQAAWDGVDWLHASIALDSMPTYEDLVLLHRAVFGRRRYAYQVFAPESQHVNIHGYALHLWGRADGRPCLPEFGELGTI